MLGLRISPRKRLQLNETGETTVLAPQEKIRKVQIFLFLFVYEWSFCVIMNNTSRISTELYLN